MRTATASYKGHRYPMEIIDHCVWLYFRFPLSFREVEELMLARGVVLSYETIRRWCDEFGQAYANQLRRRRPLSAFSGISAHFRPRRHLLTATGWRAEMADRFAVWHEVTALDAAA